MHDDWIGLIPAAGKGLRLGLPYPKELYPVIRNNRYKPVSQFVVENLVACGVQHIVFVVNETKGQLIGYFGNGSRFGCHASYVVQEQFDSQNVSTSPGLAHALDSAYHLTCGKTVFFGMADTIMQPRDLFQQIYRAAQPEDDVLLALFPTTHPEKFGMVEHAGSRVVQIVDKPAQTQLTEMWGCIIWRPRFTEFLHQTLLSTRHVDFAAIMNDAIAGGLQFRGVLVNDGNYIDLGTYEEIMEMDRWMRADLEHDRNEPQT